MRGGGNESTLVKVADSLVGARSFLVNEMIRALVSRGHGREASSYASSALTKPQQDPGASVYPGGHAAAAIDSLADIDGGGYKHQSASASAACVTP